MKINQSRIIKKSISCVALGLLGFTVSCTDDFKRMNTNPTAIIELTENEYPGVFSRALAAGSYHPSFQTAQNLFADLYAQYYATTTGNFQSDRYFTHMGWASGSHWNPIYTGVVPQLTTIMDNFETNTPENALANIWWAFSFSRLTDYYGPVPYFDAGIPARSVKYDAQEAIYDDFFKRVTAAVAVLENHKTAEPFAAGDIIYKGDVNKWIKFANTFRLRCALRISKVDPARAKTEAEAAVKAGVFETSDDEAMMVRTAINSGDGNGISRIAGWGEFRMSATMESILKGYNDPRMTEFFQPAFNTGTYEGVRNGLSPAQLAQPLNTNDNNSNVGARWIRNTGTGSGWENLYAVPAEIMLTPESFFLRAEGVLNGWDMGTGTAKEFYEKGIRLSMEHWGFTGAVVDEYIQGTSVPIAPGDGMNSDPVTTIPVKWGATEAIQREQIGTQKWLGLFPDGFEAWAEFRRSGYPKMYTVVNSVNEDVPVGKFIRRFPFLDAEKNTNGEAVAAAAALLNGPDKASTPLWWDKN